MRAETRAVRDAIKHMPGAWCRFVAPGRLWAGVERGSNKDRDAIKTTLEAAGFRCELNGKPGTAGENIVDVVVQQ